MPESAFSHEVRLLLCGQCGAPLPAPPAGGHVTCRYCDATSEVAARTEAALAPAEREPLTAAERLAELRKQDGAPLRPPGTLPLSLMVWHGEDDKDKPERAVDVWTAARNAIEGGSPGPNDEAHLYFLTLALCNYYEHTEDRERQRAVLETAAELVTTPRYLQVLRCTMARYAVREGDRASADRWLAPCDPEPTDLYMDSAYRFARAYIATCEGNWSEVLDLLGRDIGEVPIADFLDHLSTLYRAHAFEMSGDTDRAEGALADGMRQARGTPRTFVEIAGKQDVDLCPASLPVVYDRVLRRWKIRHAVFLTVWLGALNYLAADWLADLGPLDLGVDAWWPLPLVFVIGWIINVRWRP